MPRRNGSAGEWRQPGRKGGNKRKAKGRKASGRRGSK